MADPQRIGIVDMGSNAIRFLVAEVTAAAVAELGIAVGRPLWLALKATEVQVAPA